MRRRFFQLSAIVLVLALSFFLSRFLQRIDAEAETESIAALATNSGLGSSGGTRAYDNPISDEHPALAWFEQTYENKAPFLAFAGDLTGNGLEDIIILYHEGGVRDICWMTVAEQKTAGIYSALESVRAPVENQRIRVFDMDCEPPQEYMISGEKEGKLGFAIYRIIEGELVNLFGDGMDECC